MYYHRDLPFGLRLVSCSWAGLCAAPHPIAPKTTDFGRVWVVVIFLPWALPETGKCSIFFLYSLLKQLFVWWWADDWLVESLTRAIVLYVSIVKLGFVTHQHVYLCVLYMVCSKKLVIFDLCGEITQWCLAFVHSLGEFDKFSSWLISWVTH